MLSCVVLAGPVLRLGLFWLLSLPTLPVLRETEVALYVLTPTHFDAFAAGGFVALYVVPHARRALLVAASVVFVAGLLMLLSGPARRSPTPPDLGFARVSTRYARGLWLHLGL